MSENGYVIKFTRTTGDRAVSYYKDAERITPHLEDAKNFLFKEHAQLNAELMRQEVKARKMRVRVDVVRALGPIQTLNRALDRLCEETAQAS